MCSLESRKAVVLLSGGIDSSTCVAIARDQGYAVHALSFDYHQRHRREIAAARAVARELEAAEHLVLPLPLDRIGGSALTDELEVPKEVAVDAVGERIPITYVPARNTIFLSFALAWAEVIGTGDIFIGVNAVDYSGYPDCRPEFIQAFQKLADLATREGVEKRLEFRIHTPLLHMRKSEIISTGLALGVDYGLTRSCYDPDETGLSCGLCESCRLRLEGFAEAGAQDPVRYRKAP